MAKVKAKKEGKPVKEKGEAKGRQADILSGTFWIYFPNSPKIAEAISQVVTVFKVRKEDLMLKALEAFVKNNKKAKE